MTQYRSEYTQLLEEKVKRQAKQIEDMEDAIRFYQHREYTRHSQENINRIMQVAHSQGRLQQDYIIDDDGHIFVTIQ